MIPAGPAGLPWLTLLVAVPMLGAVLVGALREDAARRAALAVAVLQLALSLVVLGAFDPARAGLQLEERLPWLPLIGASWHLGVDGLSVLFLPLVALVTGALVVGGQSRLVDRPHLYLAAVLGMGGVLSGLYAAADALVFFLFWELSLVPVHLLVAGWGSGPERRYAAAKYTLTMLVGGVPLLVGLTLFATAGTSPTFDLTALAAHPAPADVQWVAGALVALGLAFKTPIVPLHAWMPTLLTEGPTAVGVWMVGLKLGAYGLLRLLLPLAPELVGRFGEVIVLLGTIGVVYGAVVALDQPGLRRLLAFTSVSHVGLVVAGIGTGTAVGLQGAVLLLQQFALASSALLLLAGALRDRLGTVDLAALGGLAARMPRWTTLTLLAAAASIGLPFTGGFVPELTLVVSLFHAWPGLAVTALGGLVVGAGALLRFLQRAIGGPAEHRGVVGAADLGPRELVMILPLLLLSLLSGLAPQPLVDLSAATTARLAHAATLARAGDAADGAAMGDEAR